MGNRRKLSRKTLVNDLEYADDMALVSSSYEDLKAMLCSLEDRCSDLGLTISCKKSKLLAVLPSRSAQEPSPMQLRPGSEPIEVVKSFEYLGSIVTADCSADDEISKRICKASNAFHSLSCLL